MKRSVESSARMVEAVDVRKSSVFRIALLSGMALLWVIVATLQYKWATQLSAATEVRIGSNLQSLMTTWHRDFYDELSAICIAMQVGPDSGAHDAWIDYLQRYEEWNRGGANYQFAEDMSPNPDLIREMYDWETSAPGEPVLLRLNPNSKTLDSVSVPPGLQPLLARLHASSGNVRIAMRAWESQASPASEHTQGNDRVQVLGLRSNALAGWQFDAGIPAFVHPVVHHANPLNSQTPIDRLAVDWLVVVLDLGVIRNRILPELASRHFGGKDGLEYKVGVVTTGDKPMVIYSSDPALQLNDIGRFDSSMNIFGFAPNNMPGEFGQAVNHSRTIQEQEWHNFAAPGWFPVIQYGPHDEAWVLILQHRTGPVGAIARNVWHRDLMTGGVVLLLLAANMGLVVFASYRAQKLAKVQMEFVASVSHELRTPIAAIFSASENIRDGYVEGRKNLKFYGSILTSQARQLIELVDRILLFASTRSGKTQYLLCPLTVSEIFQAVRKNVTDLVEEAGCTIEEHIEPGLPPVQGDLSAVCACLQNLISNAIKYGGEEHWIGLSAACLETEKHTKEVRISVQDHGQGISNSELPHIFEPFYRSPKAVSAQIHGTGLGLALAKRVAAALGGRISVVSEIGVGSTFTLHLQVAEVDRVNEQSRFFEFTGQ
jgi:two-component system sensor histidine kinase SenX3